MGAPGGPSRPAPLEADMQLVFRKLALEAERSPAPGEVILRPRDPEPQDRAALAALVLKRRLEALPRGEGPVERLVLDDSSTGPTLDDLLAAAFYRRLLAGRELPRGAAAVAEYARVLRLGLRPNPDIPLR